jgi:pilus assembly protein CpaF
MVDARLKDGSRVNAIIPPLAIDGPILSIRRFAFDLLGIKDLIKFRTLTPVIADVLEGIVKARLNVLISGGTGTGKTTLLNVMSGFIPDEERIISIEDSAELQLQKPHVVRLETRPPNIEGKGQVTQRDLVRNSLRMRPDRIIVGEVRQDEAFDMLQAMNTGHDGSLTTVHANSPRDALTRVENMVAMAGFDLAPKTVRAQIASAINVVLQLERMEDGYRRLVSMQEINGMEGDIITMTEIFKFQRHGIDEQRNVLGTFKATGMIPGFYERLQQRGIILKREVFDPNLKEDWGKYAN